MAVESLFAAYADDCQSAKVENAAAVRAAINDLFPLVENPSTYHPAKIHSAVAQGKFLAALVWPLSTGRSKTQVTFTVRSQSST